MFLTNNAVPTFHIYILATYTDTYVQLRTCSKTQMQLDTPKKISQSLFAFIVCAMDPLHVGKQRFPLQTLSSCIAASCYVAVMMHINIACAQNSWRSVT